MSPERTPGQRTRGRADVRAAARRKPQARPRRPAPGAPRPTRRRDPRLYHLRAQQQLRRFRQGSALAVALVALLLLLWGVPLEVEGQQTAAADAAAPIEQAVPDPATAVDEAAGTIRDLAYSFYAFLPRFVLVLVLLAGAAVITRILTAVLRRSLGEWERVEAAGALGRLVVFTLAVVAALSVLAGDVRAVVGSIGLLGLAASWALQTPIESFTGWLLNSFRGYYRVGDRISVGDVFGDVYRIDILTTTVWEAGGPGKPVAAAQSTGVLITFPNWEVLRSNIINYSRDFPYVWDEVTIGVANESDLRYTARVLEDTARGILGPEMAAAAERYQHLLQKEGLLFDVDEIPRVYFSLADSWTDCTIRYLVPVRTRRRWSSAIILAIAEEIARPEHQPRILSVYPRREVLVHARWPRSDTAASSETT